HNRNRFHYVICFGEVRFRLRRRVVSWRKRESSLLMMFLPAQAAIRSSARLMFSTELATLKRKYPSPKPPKAVPARQATPASSSRASASFFEVHPVRVMLGKT